MEKDQDDEIGDCDPVLKANFLRLMNGRSVGRLREDMGDIGTGAIQKARNGDRGLRLETLAKFAAYFEIEPYRLLLPELGEMRWPFTQVTPDQFQTLDKKQRLDVENFALFTLSTPNLSAVKPLLTHQNLPTDTSGKAVQWVHNDEEEQRGRNIRDAAKHSGKRRGGSSS